MADYHTFTRPTPADPAALLTSLRALDPTAGVQSTPDGMTHVVKKNTAWTAPQITAAQNAVNNAPALTPQITAQNEIDNWPISQKAFALALIDQLNVIRSKLSPPLADITPTQALAAIRNKAGTL